MTEGKVDIVLKHSSTKFVWVEAIRFKQLSMAPEKIEVVDEIYSFYIARSL